MMLWQALWGEQVLNIFNMMIIDVGVIGLSARQPVHA